MSMSLLRRRAIAQLIQVRSAAVVVPKRWVQTDSQEEILNRYKEKLSKKAEQVGVSSIDELKDKLKDDIENTKKSLNKIDPLKELEDYEAKLSAQEKKEFKPRSPRSPTAPEEPFKTLDKFLDLEKVSALGATELEYIWRARFAHQENSMVAVVPNDVFNRFYYNARRNPSFVLPLPKNDQGDEIEMHYVQWSFVGKDTVHCMITSLVEYKLHSEFARPHTTLMFHSELQKSHQVALMNGQIEKDANITLQESQLLLLNLQRFYGALDESAATERRLKLLRDFTDGNPEFNLELLIKESSSFEN